MSAYIVEDQIINDVIEAAKRLEFVPVGYSLPEIGLRRQWNWKQLAQDLYAMNCEAVNQRYNGTWPEETPYTFGPGRHNQFIQLQSLESLKYQCCEGDVPEKNSLYTYLEQLAYQIAIAIVRRMPEYTRVERGEVTEQPGQVISLKDMIEQKSAAIQAARKAKAQQKAKPEKVEKPKYPKKPRRDWLKRRIEAGLMEARCKYHYTDDYAFDNAYNFGITDWLPARIKDDEHKTGFINFSESDFKYKSGGCRLDGDVISFHIHSNLLYEIRFKEGVN